MAKDPAERDTSKAVVPGASTDLANRMNAAKQQGGGIQPGANAKAAAPDQYALGNPVQQIGQAARQARNFVGRFFQKRSPSHVSGD